MAVKKTTEQFIEQAEQIHGDKYDYSLVNYINNHTKIKIICKKHGIFEQSPDHHLLGNGCPLCNNSSNESKVEKLLKEKKIKFEAQKRFLDCRDKRSLPFDFYLPDYNICIEYDGQQHFRPTDFGKCYSHLTEEAKQNFEIIKKHDKIKTDFCKNNGIYLLRISYKDNIIDKINSILEVK